jgi:hypothetical protein
MLCTQRPVGLDEEGEGCRYGKNKRKTGEPGNLGRRRLAVCPEPGNGHPVRGTHSGGYRLLLPCADMQTGIAEALSPQWHGRSGRGDMAGCIKGEDHVLFCCCGLTRPYLAHPLHLYPPPLLHNDLHLAPRTVALLQRTASTARLSRRAGLSHPCGTIHKDSGPDG